HLAGRARLLILVQIASQQSLLAALARVSHERSADASESDCTVRLENRPHHQTLEIKQTHVFITEPPENDGARFAIEHTLRFKGCGETIDRGLLNPGAEDVDRISLLIEPLHDALRAAIDRRTEETRDRRVALILNRCSERRKLGLAVTSETRIEILEPHELL